MSDITVDVIADPAAAHGGHARIRLKGLWLLPPAATYRIEPLDDEDGSSVGWPRGEQNPRDVQITGNGVELIVGPDIVDAPALQPGTPVRILVPAAAISAEVRWPSLPASVATKRPAVIMTPAQRTAEAEALILAKQEAERRAADALIEQERSNAKAAAAAQASQRAAEQRAAGALADQQRTNEAAAAVRLVAESAKRSDRTVPAGPVARTALNGTAAINAAYRNGHASHATSAASSAASPSTGHLATLSRTRLRTSAPATDYPTPGAGKLTIPHDASIALPRPTAGVSKLPMLTFCLGLMIPTILAAAAWKMSGGTITLHPPQSQVQAAAQPVLTTASIKTAEPAQLPPVTVVETTALSIEDIFAVGTVSPRGQSTADLNADGALALADRSLHGVGQTVDREEARFWLRKTLALQLGGEQVTWAVTQLGTLYAAPDQGAADYGKARALWEISAAQGDPVALCFLSSLHELGLGTQPNRQTALGYALKAKSKGGCRDIDTTLARLR